MRLQKPLLALVLALLGLGQAFAAPVFTGTGRYRLRTQGDPDVIFSRDLNHDGQLDVLTLEAFGAVTLFLTQRGKPFYISPVISFFTVCNHPESVCEGNLDMFVEDFTNDGNHDLLVSNTRIRSIELYSGHADGTFTLGWTFSFPAIDPHIIATGDLDHDGVKDILVASQGQEWTVMKGKPDATFEIGGSSQSGRKAGVGLTVDLDQDGHLDLVTRHGDLSDLSISFGNGDGTFVPRTLFPLVAAPGGCSVIDVDGDGHLDIVAIHSNEGLITVYPGNGDRTFGPGESLSVGFFFAFALERFNNDIALDILTFHPDGVRMRFGTANGAFDEPATIAWATNGVSNMIIEDFDGDGKLDIGSGGGSPYLTVILGNGDGTFDRNVTHAVGNHPEAIVAGDFDRDGLIDLVTANRNSQDLTTLLGNGHGSFEHVVAGSVRSPVSIAKGDVNGDGVLDVVAGQLEAITLLNGEGDGTHHPVQSVEHGPGWWRVDIGDVNGDMALDAVASNFALNQVLILRNGGNGMLGPGQFVTVGEQPWSVAVGDFDKDGRDDIVTVDDVSESVTAILQNGATIRSRTLPISVFGDDIVVGDVNEDGNLDFMTNGSGDAPILAGRGDGTFRISGSLEIFGNANMLDLADVNGDGHLDVLAGGFNDVTVFHGIGNGTFQSGVAFGVARFPTSLTTGDFDLDGRIDIAVTSVDQDAVSILRNEMNRPPVANAGLDRTEECKSPQGTLLLLDGGGSAEPDQDELDFLWSGTGVVFADPADSSTDGLFPLGSTTVTLTISDGELQDDDSTVISVSDTTPPVVVASLAGEKPVHKNLSDTAYQGSSNGWDDDDDGHHGSGGGSRRHDDDDDDGHGDDDDDGGGGHHHSDGVRLRVRFGAVDACDSTVDVTAELQLGKCGVLPTSNDQLIKFDRTKECKIRTKNGILKIHAPSLSLKVTGVDDAGNAASRTKTTGMRTEASQNERQRSPRLPQIIETPQSPKKRLNN